MRRRRGTENSDTRGCSVSRTFHREGVIIRTRCERVSGVTRDRFEIVIEGLAQVAIIDVPAHHEALLSSRIEEAVSCFVESAKLQAAVYELSDRGCKR